MNPIERLISIIAPHECINCHTEGSLLCVRCQLLLPPWVPRCYGCGRTDQGNRVCTACRAHSPLFRFAACTPYEGVAKELIHGLKFERKKDAARAIAHVMAQRFLVNDTSSLLITHVPTVPQRIRVRGYDQAELIAKELASLKNIPYASLLYRQGRQRQVGQQRKVRLQQMQQAFRVAQPAMIERVHIVLIDDVITTGATLEAAARTLRAAGAKRVSAMTFAAA